MTIWDDSVPPDRRRSRKPALFTVSTQCEHCETVVGMTIPAVTRRILMRAVGRGAIMYLPCSNRQRCGRDIPLIRKDFDNAKLVKRSLAA